MAVNRDSRTVTGCPDASHFAFFLQQLMGFTDATHAEIAKSSVTECFLVVGVAYAWASRARIVTASANARLGRPLYCNSRSVSGNKKLCLRYIQLRTNHLRFPL